MYFFSLLFNFFVILSRFYAHSHFLTLTLRTHTYPRFYQSITPSHLISQIYQLYTSPHLHISLLLIYNTHFLTFLHISSHLPTFPLASPHHFTSSTECNSILSCTHTPSLSLSLSLSLTDTFQLHINITECHSILSTSSSPCRICCFLPPSIYDLPC